MAQNEPQGKGGRGKGDRPTDPDTDPRSIHGPPPPEAPVAEGPVAEGPVGEAPVAGPVAQAPVAEGPEGGDDEAADTDEVPTDDGPKTEAELLAEIEAAQQAIAELEGRLAAVRDETRRESENDSIVGDYEAQLAALKADEAELELYRTAEITFLEKMLPQETRDAVAAVGPELQAELDRLEADVAAARNALEHQQRLIATAKTAEEAATRRLDRLLKPIQPIRAKIRDGEALRSAANKAEEAGDYARAYSIVMDDGQMQRRLAEDPILTPEMLRADIAHARQAQASARSELPGLEAPLAGLQKALRDAEAAHQTARSTLADRTLQRVSELNPKSVEPA